jgi:hypothetical protein
MCTSASIDNEMTPAGAHSIAPCTIQSPKSQQDPSHTTGRGQRLAHRVRNTCDEPSCPALPASAHRTAATAVVNPHLQRNTGV